MVERLTRIIEDGPISVLSVCQTRVEDVTIWKEWSVSKDSSIEEALLRLAAYEDTGLTPEEVAHAKDLLAAEKDGRLVTLPCKVGDTINAFRYSKEKGGLYILSDKVTSVTTNKNGYTVKTKSMFYPIKQKEGYYFAQISEYPNACADYYVGERAEAEKVLGKEQGK